MRKIPKILIVISGIIGAGVLGLIVWRSLSDFPNQESLVAPILRPENIWMVGSRELKFFSSTEGRIIDIKMNDTGGLAYIINRSYRKNISGSPQQEIAVMVDDEELGSYDNVQHLQWSLDGKHLIYAARRGEDNFIVIDRLEGEPYSRVGFPFVSPDGRVAYIAEKENTFFVVDDHKRGRGYQAIQPPLLFYCSGEGNFVYAARSEDKNFLITGDEEQKPYEEINSFAVSSDCSKRAFVAKRDGKWILIANGTEEDSFDFYGYLTFGANGRFAYVGINEINGKKQQTLVLDNKIVDTLGPSEFLIGFSKLTFSHSGTSFSYIRTEDQYGNSEAVVHDGLKNNKYEFIERLTYSPDDQKLAYFVNGWKGGKRGTLHVIDGNEGIINEAYYNPDNITFSSGNVLIYSLRKVPLRGDPKFIYVIGDRKSREYDLVSNPVLDINGKYVGYSALYNNRLFWIVETIQSIP